MVKDAYVEDDDYNDDDDDDDKQRVILLKLFSLFVNACSPAYLLTVSLFARKLL